MARPTATGRDTSSAACRRVASAYATIARGPKAVSIINVEVLLEVYGHHDPDFNRTPRRRAASGSRHHVSASERHENGGPIADRTT
jgi:hypothetical protein